MKKTGERETITDRHRHRHRDKYGDRDKERTAERANETRRGQQNEGTRERS